jgi:hypothetical protein
VSRFFGVGGGEFLGRWGIVSRAPKPDIFLCKCRRPGRRRSMNPLLLVLDVLLSFYGTQRFWFWVCVVFIAIGGVAIAANLMEPSRASF